MSRRDFRSLVVTAAILGGAAMAQALPDSQRSAPTDRLSEDSRKAIFAQYTSCQAKVDADYEKNPVTGGKTERNGISARASIARDLKARERVVEVGYARCADTTKKSYEISELELQRVVSEGTCKRWSPLTGQPTC
jgi:hypothetical protein